MAPNRSLVSGLYPLGYQEFGNQMTEILPTVNVSHDLPIVSTNDFLNYLDVQVDIRS